MSLYREQVACRDYVCERECGEPIRKGTRYVRASLPPWTEPNESGHWWSIRLHGRTWDDCGPYSPYPPQGQQLEVWSA